MKKADLSINMVVVAALALGVLIVLFFILTKSSGMFTQGALTCDSKGGECVPDKQCQYEKTTFSCESKKNEEKLVCCINPLKG
ncbi:hypothetical protein HYX03_01480 [Candidatus Woesearchaeota archaeon]|nr:hypothetical protein [Candidatus Woesearchaeota archaeon]